MISKKAMPNFMKSLGDHMLNCMKEQQDTDVVFSVRGKIKHAHLVVLSGCSEFFRENRTHLGDVFSTYDDQVIDAILKYCYTGEINIGEKHWGKFLQCAKMLQIENIDKQNIEEYENPIQTHVPDQKKLALVGSWDVIQNVIEAYDPVQNTWRQSKDFDFNRRKFASAIVNDWILIIGGLSNNKPVTTVEYVNLKDGQKYQLRPLNERRSGLAAVTLNQYASTDVYAIGGDDGRYPMNSVERWNSNRQIWETNVATLPLPVAEQSASVIDGKIYVTGGSTYVKKSFQSTNNVQMYSPATNSWSYRAPMRRKRFLHTSSAINGKLYVVGGINDPYSSHSYMNSVESYDPNANLWTEFCTLQNPRSGTSLTFFQNKYIFIGGFDGQTTNSDVLEFDVASRRWIALNNINVKRDGAQLFSIPYNSNI